MSNIENATKIVHDINQLVSEFNSGKVSNADLENECVTIYHECDYLNQQDPNENAILPQVMNVDLKNLDFALQWNNNDGINSGIRQLASDVNPIMQDV